MRKFYRIKSIAKIRLSCFVLLLCPGSMTHACGIGAINTEVSTCNFLVTYPFILRPKSHTSKIKLGTPTYHCIASGLTVARAWRSGAV